MKLTVEDVAKLTGFTAGTVREYARRMRLGTIEGRKKFFTKAEVKQLQTGKLPKATKPTRSVRKTKKSARS